MNQSEFLKLKEQIESLNTDKAALTKLQRKALFWQSHLRAQSLNVEFSVLLSDLESDESTIGPHGHNRACYQLTWKKVGKQFGFIVTNIKASKSLNLVECPEYLLEIIIPHMDDYLQRLSKYVTENATYDEEYSEDVNDYESEEIKR